MNFQEWLSKITRLYDIKIEVKSDNSSFIYKTYKFTDPYEKGEGFIISVDDNQSPSIFTCVDFPISRFNKAEEASVDDMLEASELCLAGQLNFKKTLFGRKYRLQFDLPTFKGHSQAVSISSNRHPLYTAYRMLN